MTQYTPKILAEAHSYKSLIRQFLIGKDRKLIPSEWKQHSVNEYWIGTHYDLPVTPIKFIDSCYKGYMLGYVIDPDKYQYNQPTIGSNSSKKTNYNTIEQYLHSLSGRFLCIVSDGISTRIYHDASGSLSMMYSPEQQIASSSSMLIPYAQDIDDDVNLIEKLTVDIRSGIYPFGLTSRKKIKRLLPNHYLDLDNWTTTRHWPTASFELVEDTQLIARKIATMMERTIDSVLMQGFKPYMSLTAGVDSRTLLACAKKWKKQIMYFTWELPDGIAQLDVDIASQIAEKYQLNYKSYPFEEANEHDRQEWLYRTSLSVGEVRGLSLTSTINTMDSNQPYFAGNVSEVSRGVFWRDYDDTLDELTGEEIANRLGAPPDPSIIEAAKTWLLGLPELTIREKLDLLYLEQRVGCWASEIAHGHAGGPFHIYPFSNRIIFEWMLRSPNELDYRKSKGIIKKIIEQQQPDLLAWDFNGGEIRS